MGIEKPGFYFSVLASALPLVANFAFADVPTGAQVPVDGPVSECSMPPAEAPKVYSYQLNSDFTYYVCREYLSDADGRPYYALTQAHDGEYIRLLAPPGQSQIDPRDYQRNFAVAVKICNQIRSSALMRARPVDRTSCRGQTLPVQRGT